MSNVPKLRHRLEFALFRAVETLLSVFPWATVLETGKVLGKLFWLVDARHRRVVRNNLRLMDPQMSEAEVRRIALACFAHYGAVFLGSVRMYRADADEIIRWVRLEGREHLEAALAHGKGVVEFSGHYGNWEAIAMGTSLHGCGPHAIARPLSNPLLDAALTAYRERFGCHVIPKGGAIVHAAKLLKKGEAVGFILDQDALTRGIWVKFFGQWASTYPTAGNLAVRMGIPMLPLFSWPEDDGTVTVSFGEPILPESTGDLERDTWVATQRMTDVIERQIRHDPRWYFWMHDRFKTRPGEGNPLPAPLPDPAWADALAQA